VFAQRDDLLLGAALLRRSLWTGACHGEEFRQLIAAKGVTEDAEGAWGIAKAAGNLGQGQLVQEISAQSLILTLTGGGRFVEEAAAFR
jgi:hypothetical protein